MDESTIKLFADLLQHGGSLATIVVVWVVMKAGQTAKEALASLKTIEGAVTAGQQAVAQQGQKLDALAGKLDTIHNDVQSLPLRVYRSGKSPAPTAGG